MVPAQPLNHVAEGKGITGPLLSTMSLLRSHVMVTVPQEASLLMGP